jgi:hypothetical protein
MSVFLFVLQMAAILIVSPANAVEQINESDLFQIPSLKFNDSQEKEVIQNGFSLTKSDDRYEIPEGSIIYHSSSGITRIFDSGGVQLLIAKDSDSPRIKNVPSTWPLQCPNESVIKPNANNTQIFINKKLIATVLYDSPNASINKLMDYAYDGGWIEEAYHNNIPNLGYFGAHWIVPSEPSSPGNMVQDAFFPAIQPNSGPVTIMQPVLEWSIHNHWFAFTEFWDRFGTPFSSTNINANVGDPIHGELIFNTVERNWYINITNDRTTENRRWAVGNEGNLNKKVYLALEAYHLDKNSDLSGSTIFSNILLTDDTGTPITFNWDRNIDPNAQHYFTFLMSVPLYNRK